MENIAAFATRQQLRLFRLISLTSRWFETRFTETGQFIVAATIAAAIFGIDPSRTLAAYLAAILLGLILVAIAFSLRWRPEIDVRRQLPECATTDISTSYRVSIRNNKRQPERGLVITDQLRTEYPGVESFRRTRGVMAERGLNWFDRVIGFPRWLYLLRLGRGARLDAVALPTLKSTQAATIELSFTPLRRGTLHFVAVELKKPDPLGIFFARHIIRQNQQLTALPRRYPVPPLIMKSARHFYRGGVAFATTVGDSEEFMGLREYRAGDPLRHIHWRSFAKFAKPVVKEYQDEYFDRHALVLDTFATAGENLRFEAAISAAASLLQSERPRDSILDLVFVEQKLWQLSSGRGLSSQRYLLEHLAHLTPSRTDGFAQLQTYVLEHADSLATLILIFPTWDERRADAVTEIRARGVDCLVLRITTNEGPQTRDSDHAPNDPGFNTYTIDSGALARDLSALATHR